MPELDKRSLIESPGVTGAVLGGLGDWLDRIPRWAVVVFSVALLLGVAVVDNVTGGEINVTIFYLGPVVLVTWLVSDISGITLSVASAVLWSAVNPGVTYSNKFIPVWNTFVHLAFFFVTVFLVSLARRAITSERAASRTDSLTGVANGRAFEDRGALVIADMRRTGAPTTFAYIDLDYFKRINDTLGHQQGDEVLRVVAIALESRIRSTDLVARLGGDEFGVLLPDTNFVAAERVLADLRVAVGEAIAGRWPVGMTCGAITFTAPPLGVDEMVRLADERMYAAKSDGRMRTEHDVWPGGVFGTLGAGAGASASANADRDADADAVPGDVPPLAEPARADE